MTTILPLKQIACALGVAVLLSGCDDCEPDPSKTTDASADSDGPDASEPTTTGGASEGCGEAREAMLVVLESNCAGCHTQAAEGAFSSVLDPELMIESGYIKPGDPAGSPIYVKTLSGAMPKDAPALTDAQQAALADYIKCLPLPGGDPLAPPACPPELVLGHADVIDLINQDIFAQNAEDRDRIRYLSLHHLRAAGYCDDVVAVYVQALNKLVNSLSRDTNLAPVAEVPGSHGLIFRIDLSDYGWTREIWDEIACANPFAIDFFNNAQLDESDLIREVTGAPIFVQPADAFLRLVSQPPFYHDILQIPDNLTDFLALEGLNIDDAVADVVAENSEAVARAGFAKSGVAKFNRIIEWYEISMQAEQYCWISHDFNSNDDFSDILEHPLDFADAAREVICSLPNGLQMYMIVDGDGARIDAADPAIVTNVEHEGDAVINGISCMGCHRDGLRDANDEVRDHVNMFPEKFESAVLEAVLKLYPPAAEFQKNMAANRKSFADAMALLGIPHQIKVGGGRFIEPIFLIDLAFEKDLDLGRVAAELGTTPNKVASIEKLLPDVAKVLATGGVMTRAEFAKAFPLAVEALKLGDGLPFEACIDPG